MPSSRRNSVAKSTKGKAPKKTPVSSGVKAGLKFPVSRIGRMLRRDRINQRLTKGSQVVLASCLEYIASEILELSGNICLEKGKKRIVPRHLMLAIQGDEELCKLTDGAIFRESGVLGHIETVLLPPPKKVSAAKQAKKASGPVIESQEV